MECQCNYLNVDHFVLPVIFSILKLLFASKSLKCSCNVPLAFITGFATYMQSYF